MITLKNVHQTYNNKDEVLKGISFTFANHGIYVIKGASGCGKSTLIKCLLGIEMPSKGIIKYDDIDLGKLDDKERSDFRFNNIGYVAQASNTLNFVTVKEALKQSNIFSKHIDKNVNYDDMLKRVGLNNPKQKVSSLSGGELQRLELVKAIIKKPKVLLCDEPTSGLDNKNKGDMYGLLGQISQHIPVILVTHEEVNEYINDYVELELKNGVLIINKEYQIHDTLVNTSNFAIRKTSKIKGLIRYNLMKFSYKKIRSMLLVLITIFGFAFSGVLYNFIESLEISLNESLQNILRDDSFVVTSKYPQIGMCESLSKNDIETNDDFNGYESIGYIYDCNYEDLFSDSNNFYYNDVLLSNLSLRSINEFVYDDTYNLKDEFEIVLGLDAASIYSLSHILEIDESLESLNFYILNNDFQVTLSIKNEIYGYEETIFFEVNKVVYQNTNCIIHNDIFFNEKIIEGFLHFPTTNNVFQKLDAPNIMRKYVTVKYSDYEVLRNVEKRAASNVLMENINNLLKLKNCQLTYCFFKTDGKYIRNTKSSKYILGSNYAYMVNSDTGLSGFAGFWYMSKEQYRLDNLKMTIDDFDEYSQYNVIPEDGILKGNILNVLSNNVELRPIDRKLDVNQLIVSSQISNYLGVKKGDLIFATYYIDNDWHDIYLEIADVIDSDDYYIYQNPTWFYEIVRDHFKVSSFNNLPIQNEIFFENEYDESVFNNYVEGSSFIKTNASHLRKQEISTTISNIKIAFLISFVVILITNILLTLLINKSINIDSKSEYDKLYSFGISKSELAISDLIRQTIITLISLCYSYLLIVFLNKFLIGQIDTFIIPITNDINAKTLLLILGLAVVSYIPFLIIAVSRIKTFKNNGYCKEKVIN